MQTSSANKEGVEQLDQESFYIYIAVCYERSYMYTGEGVQTVSTLVCTHSTCQRLSLDQSPVILCVGVYCYYSSASVESINLLKFLSIL